MYKVYILKSSADGSKYIGTTINLANRLKEHNNGETKSTKGKTPYKLVWYCEFGNKEKAYSFEKYLKSSSGYAFARKRLV